MIDRETWILIKQKHRKWLMEKPLESGCPDSNPRAHLLVL